MPSDPTSADRARRPTAQQPPERLEEPSVLNDLPQFALEFAFDDPVEPHTVTVFDAGEDAIATHWVTVDADHAVDLAACA